MLQLFKKIKNISLGSYFSVGVSKVRKIVEYTADIAIKTVCTSLFIFTACLTIFSVCLFVSMVAGSVNRVRYINDAYYSSKYAYW